MQRELQAMVVAISAIVLTTTRLNSQEHEPPARAAQVRTEFHFVVNAPYEQAAPLFGADEERKWAPGWDPKFLYPVPAKDQQGSVFRVHHGSHDSVWTTTEFDLVAGHIQYVNVIYDTMLTRIDIRLTRSSADKTAVSVVYERTALTPEANHQVAHFAQQDGAAGPEWAEQINHYLQRGRSR